MVATDDPNTAARPSPTRQEVFEIVRPYVERHVNRLVGRNPHLESHRDDLLQVGLLELWQVAERYEPTLGKPHTFTMNRVKGAIIDHLRCTRQESGLTTRVVLRRMAAGESPPTCFSLDSEPVTPRGTGGWSHRPRRAEVAVTDPDPTDPATELAHALRRTRVHLTAAERDAIVEYFAGGLNTPEIARRRGVKKSHIAQTIKRALARIRESMLKNGQSTLN
jgi:RNA polymerase sigma factor (sigma-70 family)